MKTRPRGQYRCGSANPLFLSHNNLQFSHELNILTKISAVSKNLAINFSLKFDCHFSNFVHSQVIARTLLMWVSAPLHYILEKADSVLPSSLLHMLTKM